MSDTRLIFAFAISQGFRLCTLAALVETNVPEVVTGAKPVKADRIKVHAQRLNGTLKATLSIAT